MIIVSGTMSFGAGTRERVLQAVKAVEAKTHQEEGCITYRFYVDRDDENTIRVFEEWSSEATLAAHAKSDHLAAFRAELKAIGLEARDVKLYTVSDIKQL